METSRVLCWACCVRRLPAACMALTRSSGEGRSKRKAGWSGWEEGRGKTVEHVGGDGVEAVGGRGARGGGGRRGGEPADGGGEGEGRVLRNG